jgi:UDP-glucose 4-epimerase
VRVFITGATGFLGQAITQLLLEHGCNCAALVRGNVSATRLAPLAKKLTIVKGDLFAPESYRESVLDFAPDALIHCGWRGVAGAACNDIGQLDNIQAAAHLFNTAADAGARTIIGVGSQAEYGPRHGAVREDHPANPLTLYGVAKLAAYHAAAALAAKRGLRFVWTRVFSLYGPGDDGPWLIPSLIRSLHAGKIPELTPCEQIWEFTHVRDAAAAHVALLECEHAAAVFNIGPSAPAPLRDIVLMLRDMIAPSIDPLFGKTPYRPDQIMHLEADIARIQAATNWAPRISIEEGLLETVASFRVRQEAA